MTVPTREVLINGRWPLVLPEHRASREEWATGWEPERLDSMYANLRPGMVVYDIGTEEGDLSALFARWVLGDVGGVVLVEPNPRVWPNVRCIWEANGLPDPLACVVGFAGDENRGAPALTGWPPCADGPIIGDHGFLNVLECPDGQVVTIDALAEIVGPPDVITMDVEGAEVLAIRGAQHTLAEHRPLVWVSVHAEAMFHDHGVYQAEFHSMLHRHGYEKVLLGFDHELHVFYFPSERRGVVVLP